MTGGRNDTATGGIRLVIVGDSTVCIQPEDSPCRGWGQFIQDYFDGTVLVINRARSGRSTKTFLQEGLWSDALAEKPDYVLIQFGHNDSHEPGRPESTDAAGDYRDNLRRYVGESRAAGATPILVTPMHRRTFGADGTLADTLRPYADAMEAVAAEENVALIDLHAASGELFARLGDEASAEMAHEPGDRTHFNERGAKVMAGLVMKELGRAAPRLGRLGSPAAAARLHEPCSVAG